MPQKAEVVESKPGEKFAIDADMNDEEKEAFIHAVDRRWPVSENLLKATPVQVKVV